MPKDLFFLLHRPRRWNAGEGLWMGYERKRGKLLEFNALLRGGPREFFRDRGECGDIPDSSSMSITLDTDTQLPRDAARQLIGSMAHPLNRPVFDARGELSSKATASCSRASASACQRPAVLVRPAFRRRRGNRSLHARGLRRLPGRLSGGLLHREGDLRRGCVPAGHEAGVSPRTPSSATTCWRHAYARSALVSDVEFYEEYPSRYNVDIDRRHRWIRGDWQIARWLLPRVPGPDGRSLPNPLSRCCPNGRSSTT
jgi:cyclic beta-1,2-glucan synthetase